MRALGKHGAAIGTIIGTAAGEFISGATSIGTVAKALAHTSTGVVAAIGANYWAAQLREGRKLLRRPLTAASGRAIAKVLTDQVANRKDLKGKKSVLAMLADLIVENHQLDHLDDVAAEFVPLEAEELVEKGSGLLAATSLSKEEWERYLEGRLKSLAKKLAKEGLHDKLTKSNVDAAAETLHENYGEALFAAVLDLRADHRQAYDELMLRTVDAIQKKLTHIEATTDATYRALLKVKELLRKTLPTVLRSLTETHANSQTIIDLIHRLSCQLPSVVRESVHEAVHGTPLSRTAGAVKDFLCAVGWKPLSPGATPLTPVDAASEEILLRSPDAQKDHLITCILDMPTASHVRQCAERRTGRFDAAWLITAHHDVDSRIATEAKKHGVQVATVREVIFEALELDGYVSFLNEELAKRLGEREWFVDPAFTNITNRDFKNGSRGKNLKDELGSWIRGDAADDGQRALLGDYGSGKTSFALHFCMELIENFGSEPTDRIPLFLRTAWRRGARTVRELRRQLAEEQKHHPRTRLTDAAVFERLRDTGRLLVVVDGLDELVFDDGDRSEHIQDLLDSVHGDHAKTLVTSRANFFESLDAERLAFSRAPVKRLEPFDDKRIVAYVSARAPDKSSEILKVISTAYNFPDLATRPVLLNMILDNWDHLESQRKANPRHRIEVGDLYRIYTERWLSGASRDDKQKLSRQERTDLMVSIAVWMEDNPDMQLSSDRLREACPEDLPHDLAEIKEEILLQTFLVRTEDRFEFAHRSFQEYFLAHEVAREVTEWQPRLLAKELQPEVIDFTSVHGLELDVVWERIEQSRLSSNDPQTNGNLLSILRDQNASFRGRDLRNLRAIGANLRGAELAGGDFRGAWIKSCDISDANVRNADFSGATLLNLVLGVRSVAKCVRFLLPESDAVLTGNRHSEIQQIPIAENQASHTLHSHTDSITGIAVSRSGRVVASCGFDGRVAINDLHSRKPPAFHSHNARVFDVAIDPTEEYVASSGAEGRLRVWSRSREEVVDEWTAHTGVLYSVDWSPDGTRIVTGSFDKTVGVWKCEYSPRFQLRLEHEFKEHDALVNGVRFSPDSKFIAAASNNGTVRVFDIGRRAEVACLADQDDLEWAVAFHPNGDLLVTAGSDANIRIWDWRDERLVRSFVAHEKETWTLDIDPTGRFIASGSLDNSMAIWDFETGDLIRREGLETTNHKLRAHGINIEGVEGLSRLQERILLHLREQDDNES